MSVKALCEAVLRERFRDSPPFRGEKPFVIVPSESDRPRALVTDALWLGGTAVPEYQVALTCSESVPNQFVYQYAHELAHFYLTPIEHPLFEVLAVAVSLFVLDACACKWENQPRGSAEQRYASRFSDYRKTVVGDARFRLQTSSSSISKIMPRGSQPAESILVNDYHIVAGSVVCTYLLEPFDDWRPLLSLHRFVIDSKYCDLDLWLQDLAREDYAFATTLHDLLGPVFHITEPASLTYKSRFRRCFCRYLCCCFMFDKN